MSPETTKPSVLFVCVHNAGRSQMAAAYLTHLSRGRIEVRSGLEAGEQIVVRCSKLQKKCERVQ